MYRSKHGTDTHNSYPAPAGGYGMPIVWNFRTPLMAIQDRMVTTAILQLQQAYQLPQVVMVSYRYKEMKSWEGDLTTWQDHMETMVTQLHLLRRLHQQVAMVSSTSCVIKQCRCLTVHTGSYGTYPEPAGGYGSYGAYKRAVEFVKRLIGA